MSQEIKIFSRIDLWLQALSRRERVMVLAALFLVPIYLFFQLSYLPGVQLQQKMVAQCNALNNQNDALQAQLIEISAAVKVDPKALQQQQIDSVLSQIASFDQELNTSMAGMVPPQHMASLLREMLQQRADLTLLSMKNIAAQPLVSVELETGAEQPVEEPQVVTDNAAGLTLYRHGIELQFSGSYMATVKYFRSLQQLPQRLFWDAVSIESDVYPLARVRVHLYTLSPEKGWISG